ncbi:MAG: hypothetical protein Fur0015_09590 [Ignavibacteriales bacterium]
MTKMIIDELKPTELSIWKKLAKNIEDASLIPTSPNDIGGIIDFPNNKSAEYHVKLKIEFPVENDFRIRTY